MDEEKTKRRTFMVQLQGNGIGKDPLLARWLVGCLSRGNDNDDDDDSSSFGHGNGVWMQVNGFTRMALCEVNLSPLDRLIRYMHGGRQLRN